MTIELNFTAIRKWIKNRRAFFGLIVAGIIYWWSGDLIQWFDPAAGTYEKGHVQRWIYLFATALVIQSTTNLMMRWNDRKKSDYYRDGEGADDYREIDKTSALWMFTAKYIAWLVALSIAFLAL